jgi:hypothetical protein
MNHRCDELTPRQFVATSQSLAEVLRRLHLRPAGGNYAVLKRRLRVLGIDVSHFRGQGHLKGRTHAWARPTPLELLLVANCTSGVTTSKLKARLLVARVAAT